MTRPGLGGVADRCAGIVGGAVARLDRGVAAYPRTTRWLLAGPGALIGALLFVLAMPVWLPAGAAGIGDIVWPLVLAPLIWTGFFTYACLEERLMRGIAALAVQAGLCGVLVAAAVSGAF